MLRAAMRQWGVKAVPLGDVARFPTHRAQIYQLATDTAEFHTRHDLRHEQKAVAQQKVGVRCIPIARVKALAGVEQAAMVKEQQPLTRGMFQPSATPAPERISTMVTKSLAAARQATVPSLDPPSTTIHSNPRSCWARCEAMVNGSASTAFSVVVMIETRGE